MTDVGNSANETLATKPGQQLPWPWLVAGIVLLLWIYAPVFSWLVDTWLSDSDYSHGFIVSLFSAYLLWSTRSQLQQAADQGATSGLVTGTVLLMSALLLRLTGIVLRIQTFEGLSLIPLVIGLATITWGRPAIRWATPAALFLLFMIPLPSFLSGQLSSVLQSIATQVSTFVLQTLGIPAIAEGNIISLTNGQIGVAEACSGIRMLYSFFALTVGACLIIDRVRIEKVFIAASAIPIAIAANSIRIIATGVAYEYLDPATAEHIFHEVAGWAMMPLGFVILLGALAILDRLIVPDERLSTGNF